MRNGYMTSYVVDTIVAKATSGAVNQFNLSKLQTYKGKGMGRAVLGFFISLTNSAFAITADKNLDGMSMAQLLARTTFRLSPKSPPALGYGGGGTICNSLAGDVLLDSLGWVSDVRSIVSRGQDVLDFPAGAADLITLATSQAIFSQQRSRAGWGLNQGPFGTASGAAGFSDSVVFFLPFGMQHGENPSSTAIPNFWMNGHLGAPGVLEIILGQAVDNQTVTWTPGNIELRVLEYVFPLAECPRPTVPHFELNSDSSKNIRVRNGIRSLLAFRKELSAAGAQVALDYTTVDYMVDGEPIIDSVVANNSYDQNALISREDFKFTVAATAKAANYGSTRVSRPGIAIVANDRSRMFQPGLIEEDGEAYLKITTSGETAFSTWDITLIPRTPAFNAACDSTNLVQALGGTSSTRNGNIPADHVAQLLPAKTVAALK